MQGPVIIYVAPVGTTEPADSVAYQGSWPSGWSEIGITNAALNMTITQDTNQIQPQQSPIDDKEVITKYTIELNTEILATTFTNLFYITNGTVTTTAAGASQVGKDEITFGDTFSLPERAWGFEAQNGAGFVQRFIVRRATSKSNGDVTFDRDNQTIYPLMVHALCPGSGIKPVYGLNVTAAATS
jgi:hypothetical protein